MYDFGTYIGRFQPFHRAHLETVRFGLQLVKQLFVVVGSDSEERTIKNPWTTNERMEMIRSCLTTSELMHTTLIPVKDQPHHDDLWVETIRHAVTEMIGHNTKGILVGCPRDASGFYLKLFPSWEFIQTPIVTSHTSTISATRIRALMFSLDKIGIKNLVPSPVYDTLLRFMETPEFDKLHEEYHLHVRQDALL